MSEVEILDIIGTWVSQHPISTFIICIVVVFGFAWWTGKKIFG